MSSIDGILRRSVAVDTSGAFNPPAIQATIQQSLGGSRGGGGVYTDNNGSSADSADAIFSGRVSLGFIGVLVIGSLAFYLWTHEIQGGG